MKRRNDRVLLLAAITAVCSLAFAVYAHADPPPPPPPPNIPTGGVISYGMACGMIALYGMWRFGKK